MGSCLFGRIRCFLQENGRRIEDLLVGSRSRISFQSRTRLDSLNKSLLLTALNRWNVLVSTAAYLLGSFGAVHSTADYVQLLTKKQHPPFMCPRIEIFHCLVGKRLPDFDLRDLGARAPNTKRTKNGYHIAIINLKTKKTREFKEVSNAPTF